MSWDDDIVDPFLAELPEDADLEALASSLQPVSPRGSLRDAILGAARLEGRLDRFAAVVADLLDVRPDRASVLLDGIARPESWVPSPVPPIELYHVEGGPAVAGAITGFTRLPAGAAFPEHEHLGEEAVLIVQGSLLDGVTGAVHRPGDVVRMSAHTVHHFVARPGPALVYLVVLHGGLRIGEMVIPADDPRL